MIKRFWPLAILIVIVVLSANIIPTAAGLLPHIDKRGTLPSRTVLYIDSPLGNFPDNVKVGESFEVSGHLYSIDNAYITQNTDYIIHQGWSSFKDTLKDNLQGAINEGILYPLPDRRITVSTEDGFAVIYYLQPDINTHTTRNVHTNRDGSFRTTIQIDNLKQWHGWVCALYEGETTWVIEDSGLPILITYILDSDSIPKYNTAPLRVGTLLNLPVLSTLSYVFAGTLLAIVAYFIYRYRKKLLVWLKRRKVFRAIPEQVNIETPEESITAVDEISRANREISAGDARVEILFPQVEYPLPPVWGIGEPLTIQSHTLVDKPASDIKSQPQISTSYGAIDITVSGYSPLQLEHTFDSKGEIRINVHFGSDPGEKISGTRKIRIVDYREEIVALFNQLIDSLATKGVKVARMMTAREIEMKLKEKYPDLESDVMQVIVKGFEYADYSLHPVARKIYIEVYLAAVRIGERFKNA
jgi:hypothetical protein